MTAAALRADAETAARGLPALVLSAERLAAMIAPGAHGLRRAGPGEDFWQYRPARPDEPLRAIDWRRSARSDARFVRDREGQTAQAVTLWLARGAGMDWSGAPATRPTKAARGRLLTLALAMILLRGGEKVGLGDDPPRAGRVQADRIAAGLVQAASPLPADDDLPSAALLRPNRRAVLIGDFLGDPALLEGFLGHAAGMGVRGALLQVLDPDESDFPYAGAVLFRSATGALRHDTRDAAGLRGAYRARLAERRDRLARAADRGGWRFGTHDSGAPPATALVWLHQVLGG